MLTIHRLCRNALHPKIYINEWKFYTNKIDLLMVKSKKKASINNFYLN